MSSYFIPIQTLEINDNLPYNAMDLSKSEQVFIQGNKLIQRWQEMPKDSVFVIAEVGFGAGLNFLLTWSLWQKYAPPTAKLYFISGEKHPLSLKDLHRCLALWPELETHAKAFIEHYPILTPGFHDISFESITLLLMLGDELQCFRELLVCGDAVLEDKLRTYYIDACFLNNAFENQELLAILALLSKDTTTLTAASYSEKINLQTAGFKKDNEAYRRAPMIQLPISHKARHTPWHTTIPKPFKNKKAIVIGAGLAGCYTANALAKRGWLVTLLDAEENVGVGASGNSQAVLYPKLSSFYSPLNKFMLNAYLYAIAYYKKIINQKALGDLSGILLLAYNQKERIIQENLTSWLENYPDLGRLVSAQEASALSGVILQSEGLYMPHSGWINSPALCKFLINNNAINYVPNTEVLSLDYNRQWHANGYSADVLIIANGHHANRFKQTKHLPLKAIRGQMTLIKENEQSKNLRIPLCAAGHIIPSINGVHALGATFHSGCDDKHDNINDDIENITKLNTLSTMPIWSNEISGHWSGIRAATPDYLPLVGPIAEAEKFKEQFLGLANNSKRWIPSSAPCYPGLYICSGFGSRGLTTIPFSAEWLATIINGDPGSLSRTMVQSLSPARFLRREIIRS